MTELNLPLVVYVVFAFIFGLIIGSFLNVVIHRVPREESIVLPGSHCPACRQPIRPIDNIPLFSYLILRGRCRQCGARISPVYPLVELLTAAVFAAIVSKTGPTWEALPEMVFAWVMIALIIIDARHHLLPNVITYPAFVFALCAAAVRSGWGEPVANTIDLSIIFITPKTEFIAWRAALIGGVLIALAAPGFRLLEQLDLILFNKYFEWEEMNEVGEASDTRENGDEVEMGEGTETGEIDERQNGRTMIVTMIVGLLVALIWAALVMKFSPDNPQNYEDAYSGLLRASAGALIGGGLIWWLRAVYFYLRGLEGMGLGDVKMISIIGAFLGWMGMFGVLLLGSTLGAVVGVIMAYRSRGGLKTPLPFGACLGIAALIVMLTSTPFFK